MCGSIGSRFDVADSVIIQQAKAFSITDQCARAFEERRIDHLSIHHVRTDAACFGVACRVEDAQRMGDLLVGRTEDFVGERNLAWMDAALAEKTHRPGELCFGTETFLVLDVGERGIVGEHIRFAGRNAQAEHGLLNGNCFATRNTERLEQIAQAELQARDARVRSGKLGGVA